MASKYDPLEFCFAEQPDDVSRIELAFTDIELILHERLPATAYAERSWWANTKCSTHASRWLDTGWQVARRGVDLENETVVFVRTSSETAVIGQSSVAAGRQRAPHLLGEVPAMARHVYLGRRRVYDSFRTFLEEIPEGQAQVALTFGEIEATIGRTLPKTACRDRTWWANTDGSPQGRAWLGGSWRVDQIYLTGEVVVFRRPNTDLMKLIRHHVKALLDGKPRLERPIAAVLANWVRTCRQVGWFFDATVLYENYGSVADGMGEAEAAAVEEDYQVCKRELTRHQTRSQ